MNFGSITIPDSLFSILTVNSYDSSLSTGLGKKPPKKENLFFSFFSEIKQPFHLASDPTTCLTIIENHQDPLLIGPRTIQIHRHTPTAKHRQSYGTGRGDQGTQSIRIPPLPAPISEVQAPCYKMRDTTPK